MKNYKNVLEEKEYLLKKLELEEKKEKMKIEINVRKRKK